MEFNLKRLLLALLTSSSEPLGTRDVQAVLTRFHEETEAEAKAAEAEAKAEGLQGDELQARQQVFRALLDQVPSLLTATQIRDAMDELQAELVEQDAVTRIVVGPDGWRLTVAPSMADWVRLLRKEPKPQRLSSAQMETLAVIAYRQPVTRTEIEAIRGVAADGALSKLLEADLVQVSGRAELPGRPMQYGTTTRFLEFTGLRSIDELPASDVLTPAQLTEFVREATQPKPEVQDAEVGLPVD